MNTQSSVKICPKCGAENGDGSQNCIACHINLQWAFENLELLAEMKNIDNEVHGKKQKFTPIVKLGTGIFIGAIAGFIGGFVRIYVQDSHSANIGISIISPPPHWICMPIISPFAGIISALVLYPVLSLVSHQISRGSKRARIYLFEILFAILGFLAGFLPFEYLLGF